LIGTAHDFVDHKLHHHLTEAILHRQHCNTKKDYIRIVC